ncbi:hypothetical protein Tco_1274235 [Tanacetum coccineum]
MASFDYRLNPLYAIKECSSCGALYTSDYCCSKGVLEDKIPCSQKPTRHKTTPTGCVTVEGPLRRRNRRIAEDQAAKDRYWKIPICYDDDEDYTIAITPVLSTEEPIDSLIMEDEPLDAISATESDEVIKSSIENLVPTPTFEEHFEIVIDFNDDSTSSDDGSPYGEDIEYVDASSPDSELVSLEVVENVTSEDGEIEDDILHYEALYLNDDHIEEMSSGNTTTHADFSQYDSFIFDLSIDPFPPSDRSDCYHKEFTGELAHIISPPEYDWCVQDPDLNEAKILSLGKI